MADQRILTGAGVERLDPRWRAARRLSDAIPRSEGAGGGAVTDADGAHDAAAVAAAIADATAALRRGGVRPGDRVLLAAENCLAFLAFTLAADRCDAWAVPVNARVAPAELARIRAAATPRLAVFTAAASPEAAAHAAAAGTRPCAGAFGRAAITGPDRAARPEATHADPAAQTAALFYTTGTTGRPKGVRLSRRSLLFSAASSAELRGFAPGGHVLAALPGAHIFGFASILLAALFAGARLTLLARFDADAALDAFAAGADAFSGTPQMYPPLLARLAARVAAGAPAPRPRYVSAGGAPLDPALKARVEAAFGAPLHNGYGLTEAAPGVAATRPAAPRGDLACGPPMPGVSIRLDFAVGGAEPAAGIGEILARGPNVMQGYHRDPAATRAALDAEGWLRTGDLGRFTADGALEVLGRRSELIIRGGFNVRPAEVEAALASHSAVALAAVIGRPEPGGAGDEEVLAFVTLRPGAPAPSVAALRAHLAPRLTAYKRPSRIILADALPASATGKVLKSELARAFAEQLRGAAPR